MILYQHATKKAASFQFIGSNTMSLPEQLLAKYFLLYFFLFFYFLLQPFLFFSCLSPYIRNNLVICDGFLVAIQVVV